MKLIGNLKKQVDNTPDFSEKRSLIEKAGMALSDAELEMVAGGVDYEYKPDDLPIDELPTTDCIGWGFCYAAKWHEPAGSI